MQAPPTKPRDHDEGEGVVGVELYRPCKSGSRRTADGYRRLCGVSDACQIPAKQLSLACARVRAIEVGVRDGHPRHQASLR